MTYNTRVRSGLSSTTTWGQPRQSYLWNLRRAFRDAELVSSSQTKVSDNGRVRVWCVREACLVTWPNKLVGVPQSRILQMHHFGTNGLMLGCPLRLVKETISRRSPEWRRLTRASARQSRQTLLEYSAVIGGQCEPRCCRQSSTLSFALVETENNPPPRSHRALRGWKMLAPSDARLLLTFVCLVAMVGRASALATMNGFSGCLRPSELVTLQQADLMPPQVCVDPPRSGTGACHCWPTERDVPSNTLTFDESVMLDSPWMTCAAPPLHWEPTPTRANIALLGAEPHSLRHGGASHNALIKYVS